MTDERGQAKMSGPDHFREAEKLLVLAENAGHHTAEGAAAYGAMAQAHATLALVAVTAEMASHAPPPVHRTSSDFADGKTYVVDEPWKALLNPHEREEATDEPPF